MSNIQDIRGETPKRSSRRSESDIKKVARHHTATNGGDFWAFWNNRWKGLGWSTGGYHEIILRDGTVQLCYDPTVVTNGVGGHNSSTYHIALVGSGSFTDAQEKAWHERAQVALNRFNLSANDVLGHKEFSGQNTQCPGIDMDKIRSQLRGIPQGTKMLRRGDKGNAVKKLQEDLMKAGEELPHFGADGDFGIETEAAVKSFQEKHGLTVDGIAGPKTLAKLEEVLNQDNQSGSSGSSELLRRGAKGEAVKKLQEDLMKAGEELPRFGADGDFGIETEAAVKSFQEKHGLTVDGIAGPKTFSKLEEVLKNSSTGENDNSDEANENNNNNDATNNDNDSNNTFKDVTSGHWAYDAIEFVRIEGIMQGFEDGTFRPEEHVTRAELATVIKKLMEK